MAPKKFLLLGFAALALAADTGCLRIVLMVPSMPSPGAGATGAIAAGPGLPGAAGPSVPTSAPGSIPLGPQVPASAVQAAPGPTLPPVTTAGTGGAAVAKANESIRQQDGSGQVVRASAGARDLLLGWAACELARGGEWVSEASAACVKREVGMRAGRIATRWVQEHGRPFQAEGRARFGRLDGESARGLMGEAMRCAVTCLRSEATREGQRFQAAERSFHDDGDPTD